jgi:LytS/YehU family sensor histidine kinase
VNLNVTGDLKTRKIPPMILFFLIENCFKHGSSLDAGSPWIKVEISSEPERILLLVENSKPVNPSKNHRNDIQLKHLRKRLDIMYKPSGYDLKIWDNDDSFKVHIELKQEIENI